MFDEVHYRVKDDITSLSRRVKLHSKKEPTTMNTTVNTNTTTNRLKMRTRRALLCGLAGLSLMMPTLHPAAASETGTPRPIMRQDQRADLTIVGIVMILKPGGQTDLYHCWPQILNQGLAASKPCTLTMQVTKGASSVTFHFAVPALQPGQATNVTVGTSLPQFAPGTTTLFEADAFNDVNEQNEFNNTYSVMIP